MKMVSSVNQTRSVEEEQSLVVEKSIFGIGSNLG